jgi:hypothetical protein
MTTSLNFEATKAIFFDLDNTLIMTRTADSQACEMVSFLLFYISIDFRNLSLRWDPFLKEKNFVREIQIFEVREVFLSKNVY